MQKLFVGFLLIFLDFNLNFNSHTLGLLPDFIGYILLLKGMKEMSAYSPRFIKAQPFAIGMSIYTAILYALNLFGVMYVHNYLATLLGLISVAVSLYISYQIIGGIRDIETAAACDLNGEKLASIWKLLAIFQLVTYLLLLIPALALVAIIASCIVPIVFLVAFNRAKNLFAALPQPTDAD